MSKSQIRLKSIRSVQGAPLTLNRAFFVSKLICVAWPRILLFLSFWTGRNCPGGDFVHSTTTLEMVRGLFGVDFYRVCLAEIYRILRPGGIFGLGEPMHLDVPIPDDLSCIYTKGGGMGPEGWADCFATVSETATLCRDVGFNILEADHAPDAWNWWQEFSEHDPHCQADPQGEAKIIRQDGGRWLSYGYVIAQKPW